MDLEKLSQTEVADLLTLSTRQVRNLEDEGLPSHSRAGKKSYVWREVLAWTRERWELAARATVEQPAPSALEQAGLRKAVADAEYSEMRSQRERELLVKERDAEAEAEIWRFCERVRAVLLSIRSRHQASMVGLRTIVEAGLALDRIVAAILTDLKRDAGGAHEVQDLREDKNTEEGAA